MESKKSHIGLVLEENYTSADLSIRAYERLSMKLNPLAEAYDSLGIGKFSKEILADLIDHKTIGVQKRIVDEAEAQIKASGIKLPALVESHKQNSLKAISPFLEMVNSFLALYELESSRDRVSLDLLSMVNGKGRLVINRSLKDQIKCFFEIKIESEEQSQFYDRFLELKKNFEAFMKLAKEYTVIDKEVGYWSTDAITYIDNNGELNLNHEVIQEIKHKANNRN